MNRLKPSNGAVADVTFQYYMTSGQPTLTVPEYFSLEFLGKWIWWKILFWACECQGKFHPAWPFSLFWVVLILCHLWLQWSESISFPLLCTGAVGWGGAVYLRSHRARGAPCAVVAWSPKSYSIRVQLFITQHTHRLLHCFCCIKRMLCTEIHPSCFSYLSGIIMEAVPMASASKGTLWGEVEEEVGCEWGAGGGGGDWGPLLHSAAYQNLSEPSVISSLSSLCHRILKMWQSCTQVKSV